MKGLIEEEDQNWELNWLKLLILGINDRFSCRNWFNWGYNCKEKGDLKQIEWNWNNSKSKNYNENKECLSGFLFQFISIIAV